MRKIKELEKRIDRLESIRNCDNEVCANRYDLNRKWLMDIEAKQKEQEEALKIVVPIIDDILLQELVKNTYDVLGIPSKLFAEISKKKENKKTDTKRTSKTRTKKETK